MHMQKIKSRSMVRAKRRCHLLLLNALTLILTLILIRLPCVCSSCKPSPKTSSSSSSSFSVEAARSAPTVPSRCNVCCRCLGRTLPPLGGGGERRRRGGGMAFDNIFFCEKNWGITYTPTGFWYLKNTIWVPFYVLFFFW